MMFKCLAQGHYCRCQQIRTGDLTIERPWPYPLSHNSSIKAAEKQKIIRLCRIFCIHNFKNIPCYVMSEPEVSMKTFLFCSIWWWNWNGIWNWRLSVFEFKLFIFGVGWGSSRTNEGAKQEGGGRDGGPHHALDFFFFFFFYEGSLLNPKN